MIQSCFLALLCLVAACDKTSFTLGGAKVAGPFLAKPTSIDASADAVTPETRQFWIAFATPTAKGGDVITAKLVAVDVGAVAPPNTMIAEASLPVPAGKVGVDGAFDFSAPDKGWPAGKYAVQLTRNTELMATTTFPIMPKAP